MAPGPGMYVDALDEFVECDGDRVLYKRKVSESSKKSVDENVKLNVEGFNGFESESEEEEDEEQTSEIEPKYDAQQKGMVQRVMSNYVYRIVSNLEDRFVENDQVSKFSIFIPSCIVSAEKEGSQSFFKFGMDELNFIDRASCVSEYRQYKRLVVGSFSNSSLSSCAESIFINYNEIIPNLVRLLELIPISSVPSERGFSTQNRILSRFRTSVKQDFE